MVAVEIRPPPARIKIGALACYVSFDLVTGSCKLRVFLHILPYGSIVIFPKKRKKETKKEEQSTQSRSAITETLIIPDIMTNRI